jgi:hypothetical protein
MKEKREKQEERRESTGAEITKSKQRHIPSAVCGFNLVYIRARGGYIYKFSTVHSALFFLR